MTSTLSLPNLLVMPLPKLAGTGLPSGPICAAKSLVGGAEAAEITGNQHLGVVARINFRTRKVRNAHIKE